MTTRPILALASSLLLAASLAACGSSSDSSDTAAQSAAPATAATTEAAAEETSAATGSDTDTCLALNAAILEKAADDPTIDPNDLSSVSAYNTHKAQDYQDIADSLPDGDVKDSWQSYADALTALNEANASLQTALANPNDAAALTQAQTDVQEAQEASQTATTDFTTICSSVTLPAS